MDFLKVSERDFLTNSSSVKLSFSESPKTYYEYDIDSEVKLLISGASDSVFPIVVKLEECTFIGWDTKVFGVDDKGGVKIEIGLLSHFFNFVQYHHDKLIVISELEVYVIDIETMMVCNKDTFGDLIVDYELTDSRVKVLLDNEETYFVSMQP